MSFAFDPYRPVAQNLSRLGAAELRTALNTARDVSRDPGERIHEVRTHCKRVRALLRIVGSAFSGYRTEDRAVRNAAVLLSGARDGVVMLETLAGLELDTGDYPPAELDRLRHTLGAPAGARDDEAALIAFAGAIEPVYRRALSWHGDGLDCPAVSEAAADTYQRAFKAMRKADKSRAAEDFHDWRKQVKYNWHHLALLRRFAPDRFRTARTSAKELGTLLGDHHDRDVLHQHVHMMHKPRPVPGLGKLIRNRNSAAADKALERGAELYAASPGQWREYIAAVVAGGGVDARGRRRRTHMPLEIERKFLVAGDDWRAAATGSVVIRQGYLFSTGQMSFRVRMIDDREAVVTFKYGGGAVSRGEYEYAIPLEDARELITIAGERTLEKVRHTVPIAGKEWTVDEFRGRHAGLLLAELELGSEDEAFERPGWLGEEVTADPRYRNAELSKPPA